MIYVYETTKTPLPSTWESGKHETESMVPSLLQRTMLLLLLCSLTRARQRGNSRRAIGFVRPPIAVIFVAKCSHHSPLHHLVIIHSGLPLHAADFSSKISSNSGHCEFDRQFGSLPPIFQEMDPMRGRGRGRCIGRRGRSRAGALPQTQVVSEVPEDFEQEPEVSHEATPVPTVQLDVHTTKLFAEFLRARGYGVAQPASRDPPLPEHVANFRLCALIIELKTLGAQHFFGESDFMKADYWIRDLKNCFSIIEITSVEKRKVAVFLLQKEARVWWDTVVKSKDETEMDWEEFEALFYDKYFPDVVKIELLREFFELKQGSLTVREYAFRFYQLLRFAPEFDEEFIAHRFEEGLADHIGIHMVRSTHKTLVEAVHCAMAVENSIEPYRLYQDERRDYKGKGKTSSQSSYDSGKHGGIRKKQRTTTLYEDITVASGQQGGLGECYHCGGAGHMARDCINRSARVCYTCSQPGHIAKNCTQGQT